MKRILKQGILMVSAFFIATAAFAQYGSQWGETQEEQVQNVMTYNFFRDAYNNKDYPEALKHVKELIQKAPRAHANMYVNTTNIYRTLADQAEDPAVKDKYIDSMMMMYDLRIEYFGDAQRMGKGYITRRKAEDYLVYKLNDKAGIKKVFDEALEANGDETPAEFINIYFNELTEQYKTDQLERDEYLAEYDRLEQYMNTEKNAEAEAEKNTFTALLASSGAADCNAIEQIYRERFEANPDDKEIVSKAARMLLRGKCSGEFAARVIVKYYELEPSAVIATNLYSYYMGIQDFANASKYLKFAIDQEQDQKKKDNLILLMASTELSAGNHRAAADYARQAINANPNNGVMYIILAQAYVEGAARNCSGFDRQTVYWLASDIISNAQRLIKDESQLSRANSLAASYRSGYPSKEECFFRGLNEGSNYTVRCGWIGGNTTVRTIR